MRITIIAEEDLTHKVLAGFKNNFTISGLGSLLDVIIDEGVNVFAAIFAVADLDGVAMVAHMNARTLSDVIVVDVEDFGVAWYNARGGFLTNLAHKSGAQKQGTTNQKGFLCEAVEISIIDRECVVSMLEVIAKRVLALEMANASGQ